jgi:hypothetical protein
VQTNFGALVVGQAAHSIEEYVGRLWESFPPARWLTGTISENRERGFLVINVALVAFGVWCVLFPVRRRWHGATALAWVWIAIGIVNGIGCSDLARPLAPGLVPRAKRMARASSRMMLGCTTA